MDEYETVPTGRGSSNLINQRDKREEKRGQLPLPKEKKLMTSAMCSIEETGDLLLNTAAYEALRENIQGYGHESPSDNEFISEEETITSPSFDGIIVNRVCL
ncbi:hypothetical protein NPIL_609331 [Nephila pilipes]|uniref:Uncharacterized protein n=1 Tax=Nephila pilipes TaxID=299642 RepID=A0A8X6SZT3_NEPPI|nr:hypothetical protein NPIL_609331 [Nephila pilipes]